MQQTEENSPAGGSAAAGDTSKSTANRQTGDRARTSSLVKNRGIRFVNKMRNVGFLAGFTAPGDERSFLLMQNNNIEHALRINVNTKYVDPKRAAGRPLLMMVHVRGYRDQHGPQVAIQCIEIDKPSILDLPVDDVWVSGMGRDAAKILSRLGKEGFSPFGPDGEIRPEYRQYITEADASTGNFQLDAKAESFLQAYKMFGDVLSASGGVIDSRLNRGQNYISVAGFVDSKAWVPATEHRKAYGLVMLRQHENQEENIPVRVTGHMARRYIETVTEGSAVLIEGSVRRKVIPDDAGNIVSSHTYIETPRISPAVLGQEILEPVPVWWNSIRDRLLARRAERRATAQTAKTKAAETPSPSEGALPALTVDL